VSETSVVRRPKRIPPVQSREINQPRHHTAFTVNNPPIRWATGIERKRPVKAKARSDKIGLNIKEGSKALKLRAVRQ
jgi:hypothetical protein